MKEILFLTESLEAMRHLPDAEAGALLKALIAHTDGEEPSDLPPIAKVIYPLIAGQVDRMAKLRETNSENGKKGGRPRSEKTETKPKQKRIKTELKPKRNRNETETKAPVPVPVPVPNHNHNHNQDLNGTSPDGEGEKERCSTNTQRKSPLAIVPSIDTEEVREAWEHWAFMRKKIKKPLTERGEVLNAKKLEKLSRGDPIRAVMILEQSTAGDYQGLFDVDGGRNGKKMTQYEEWLNA